MKFIKFLKKQWFILPVALLVIACVTFAAYKLLGGSGYKSAAGEAYEEPGIKSKARIRLDLTAEISGKAGVSTESGFMLSIPKNAGLDNETVRQGLKIIPPIEYELTKTEKGVLIKPKTYLTANTVYTFQINLPEQNIKESWAFQTRREFKVIASLPRNKSTQVPWSPV